MQEYDDKICAAVRILPAYYACGHTCDLHVIHQPHVTFIATMLASSLDQIKDDIRAHHGTGVIITQVSRDNGAIVTLTYEPDYFNTGMTLQEFVIWVESLWNRARAQCRRTATATATTRC